MNNFAQLMEFVKNSSNFTVMSPFEFCNSIQTQILHSVEEFTYSADSQESVKLIVRMKELDTFLIDFKLREFINKTIFQETVDVIAFRSLSSFIEKLKERSIDYYKQTGNSPILVFLELYGIIIFTNSNDWNLLLHEELERKAALVNFKSSKIKILKPDLKFDVAKETLEHSLLFGNLHK